jgi:hypothetical protein
VEESKHRASQRVPPSSSVFALRRAAVVPFSRHARRESETENARSVRGVGRRAQVFELGRVHGLYEVPVEVGLGRSRAVALLAPVNATSMALR